MQKTIMKNRTRRYLTRCDGQKGAVLVVGLLLTTVLTMVAVNASKGTVVQQRMATNYRFSIEAMNNAETGLRSALNQINAQTLILNGFDDELDPNGDGIFDDRFRLTLADQGNNVFFNVVMVDDDDGDGNPSVDSNGIVLLMSQGTSSVGSTRTTEIRIADTPGISPVALDHAILTHESLNISGNPTQFGTNQDIHSNADINISGNPTTDGHVSAVGSLTVSGTPAGEITTQSNAAYVDIPQIEPSMFAEYADYIFDSDGKIYDADGHFVADADGNAYQGWKFSSDQWTTEGDVVLGGMLYFRGIYGNVVVASAPGHHHQGGPWLVSILADGWIEIAGNPTIDNYMNPDDPPAVQAILFMSGADIKINGNPNQTYHGIIAAKEQFDVSGNPNFEGVLIAAGESNESDLVVENTLSGEMKMTYDGGFSFPSIDGDGDATAIVLSWRDRDIARDSGVFAAVGQSDGNQAQ